MRCFRSSTASDRLIPRQESRLPAARRQRALDCAWPLAGGGVFTVRMIRLPGSTRPRPTTYGGRKARVAALVSCRSATRSGEGLVARRKDQGRGGGDEEDRTPDLRIANATL